MVYTGEFQCMVEEKHGVDNICAGVVIQITQRRELESDKILHSSPRNMLCGSERVERTIWSLCNCPHESLVGLGPKGN